jgi:hypothetical protein
LDYKSGSSPSSVFLLDSDLGVVAEAGHCSLSLAVSLAGIAVAQFAPPTTESSISVQHNSNQKVIGTSVEQAMNWARPYHDTSYISSL